MGSLTEFIGTEGLPEREPRDFECLPDGWYPAEIVTAEVRATKAGTGAYLAVQFAVTGQSHAGRRVWQNYTLRNPSSSAERIGREQLGELVRALGIQTPRDSDEMLGNLCEIRVTTRRQEGFAPRNDVQAARPLDAADRQKTVKAAVKAAAAAVQSPAAGGAAPPWARK